MRSQGVTPGGVAESVSNKCEVVYIKERNLDDYISKTAKLEGNINIINKPCHIKFWSKLNSFRIFGKKIGCDHVTK